MRAFLGSFHLQKNIGFEYDFFQVTLTKHWRWSTSGNFKDGDVIAINLKQLQA